MPIVISKEVEIVWVDDDGNPVTWEQILALWPRNPAWDEDDEDSANEEES